MNRKNIKNLILYSLIFCWAFWGFKPVYAADGDTLELRDGEIRDGLQIGSVHEYENLIVWGTSGTTNATVYSGGEANYADNSFGDNTIVNGGVVGVHDNATLTDASVLAGSLNANNNSVITGATVVGGNFNTQDNASTSNVIVEGGFYGHYSTGNAENITIKGGDAEFVNMSGPLVNGLNVQGGNVVLFLGASATGVEVTGGNVNVDDAAKLNDVEINGGTVTVSDTADISNTEIISGLLTVNGDASAEDTTINGGTMTVEDYANVKGTTVNNTGSLYVYSEGGVALDTTVINNGGFLQVQGTAGTLSNTFVTQGGEVESVGTVDFKNTTIDGGKFDAAANTSLSEESGGNNVIKNDGQLNLAHNATADGFEIEQGKVTLADKAVLSNTTITGDVEIEAGKITDISYSSFPGGFVSNAVVENGGNLWINNVAGTDGGFVENLTVKEGGTLTSNVFDSNDSTYSKLNADTIIIEKGGKFNLSTDDSIVALETVSDFSNYQGHINNGNADDIFVGNGSVFTVKSSGKASNFSVEEGTINVEAGGVLENSTVSNGEANIESGGTTDYVTFTGSSVVNAKTGSTLMNTSLLGSSTVNIEDYSSLVGSLTIGNGVLGLDASQLFNSGTGLGDLTLIGGLNSVFVSGIVNKDTYGAHSLYLTDGTYAPNDISGWEAVTLRNSILVLKKDLGLVSGALNIETSSSLISSGNLSIKNGNVYNDGTIDLVKADNSATNSLTIEGDYYGASGSKLNLNVDIATAEADKIIITGNASGSTSVYLTSLNDGAALRDDILFAEAGSTSGGNVFNVHRVAGSYYQWDTVFDNNQWFASMKNAINGDKYILVPEAVAYYGLIDNTFMQTSSLGESLRNNIAISEYQKAPCKNIKRGANSICRSNRPVFSGWLAPATTSITVDSPYVYDADIGGFDGGLDLISNGYTKLGLLASYRKGTYNYEEDGDQYEIIGQAETTINSYLAGAYLRHDGQNWSTILAGYAGMIDADISTEDDVNTSTSGTIYGATLDVSYIYKNISGFRIEPGVRVSYTAVEMDPVEDNGGKTQEFDNASRTEVEAGIKFAKRWDFPDSRAEIFVRPSIVHIMDDSSDFALDDENSMDQAGDRTVAKVTAGISFDMTSKLSASLAGSYSLGDDYTNSSGNLSVMYKF